MVANVLELEAVNGKPLHGELLKSYGADFEDYRTASHLTLVVPQPVFASGPRPEEQAWG